MKDYYVQLKDQFECGWFTPPCHVNISIHKSFVLRDGTRHNPPVAFLISWQVFLKPLGCQPGYVLGVSSPLEVKNGIFLQAQTIIFFFFADVGNDAVPGCSSLGCTLALAVATCWLASPFLPCLDARSASCRARLSAFNSALLLAGLSAGAALSEAGTGTEAGTAEGAETGTDSTNAPITAVKTGNYSLKIPFWAVFCAEGWGAGGDEVTDFSFSSDCDVLSSFLSLPFFCCFFSFLKRCFSSFVNSFPSFCTTTAQRTHYSLVQKRSQTRSGQVLNTNLCSFDAIVPVRAFCKNHQCIHI